MKRWLFALTVIPAIVALALLNPSEGNEILGGAPGSDELCCVFEDDITEN